jgi:hypothetical protein
MRFIRVNMNNKSTKIENVPAGYVGLAGRALTSIMINAEVPATCDPLAFLNTINAKFGTQLTPADVGALGTRIIRTEREFNRKAGLTEKDDRLPRFYYEEPLPPHNITFAIKNEDLDKTFGSLGL